MIKYILFLSGIIFFLGCHHRVNIEAEKINIRNILAQERVAHFNKDPDLFTSSFADSMITVHHGEVMKKSVADYRKRFEPYFNSVTFQKWDDAIEPIIDISEDGTMAYAIVNKTVVLTYPDTLGQPFYDSTQYAWVSVYRKLNGMWKNVCIGSTQNQ